MLNLKKLNKPQDDGDGSSRARPAARPASPAAAGQDPWHGRKSPPPPRGSAYGEFLEWATAGGPEWPEAVNLAVRMWMGLESVPQPEEPSAPGP